MEVKEVCCIDITSDVSVISAISWSEDHQLSVLTSNGIHTFSIMPTPKYCKPVLNYNRMWILPDKDACAMHTGVDIDTLIWELEKHQVYRLLYDPVLNPIVNNKETPTHFRQAEWGPAGSFKEGKCLLSTVTTGGIVTIYASKTRMWVDVANISKLWLTSCQTKWENISKETHSFQYHEHEQRVNQCTMTAVAWSKLFTNNGQNNCYLATSIKNGQLCIWKIDTFCEAVMDTTKVSLSTIISTDLRNITAINWVTWDEDTSFIICGDVQGNISLVIVNHSAEVKAVKTVQLCNYNIRVTKISAFAPTETTCTIIAIKHRFIIAYLVNKEGDLLCKTYCDVSPMSGIFPADNHTAIALTNSGVFYKVQIRGSKQDNFKIVYEEIVSDISRTKLAFYGLTANPCKKVLWATIATTSVTYDHLVKRKPTKLIVFTVEKDISPLTAIEQKNEVSILSNWEYFELIRIQSLKDRNPPKPHFINLNVENDSKYIFQRELWLAKISLSQLVSTADEYEIEAVSGYIKDLQDVLFRINAYNYMLSIKTKFDKNVTLTNDEVSSFFLLQSWLKLDPESKLSVIASNYTQKALQLSPVSDFHDPEKCSVCGSEVIMTLDRKLAHCPNDHIMQRCSVTLRQCEVPYRICFLCGSLAHNSVDSSFLKCIYCNYQLHLDTRSIRL